MILREGHPMLAEVCRPFDFSQDNARLLAARMLKEMRTDRGLGLAAPQIGEPVRAFVIEEVGRAIFCANPEIVARVGGEQRVEEGCLSYPGVFIWRRRAIGLNVRYFDADGCLREHGLHGRPAHAFQHEMDHLDGRTLPNMVPAQAWANAKAQAKLRAA